MTELIEHLGGPTPMEDRLDELVRWSSATLDTRRGAERSDAQPLDLSDEDLRALVASADQLGLASTLAPSRSRYDAVAVLAGTTVGNHLRVELAVDVLGAVEVECLLGLASNRHLGPSELSHAPGLGEDPVEWRHLLVELDRAFGVESSGRSLGDDIVDEHLSARDGPAVRLLVAADRAGRRATTVDQLAMVRERVAASQRRSLLVVSSAIYVPYQFFASAVQVLDVPAWVEFVGTPTALGGDHRLLAQRVGQELHAALHAASQLV